MAGKKHYVFCTLANDQLYTEWLKGGGDVPIAGRRILIKGGAGVMGPANRMVTPLGVSTEIDEEELALLDANEVFLLHKKNNHIVVRSKYADPEKVAADMNRLDQSSPRTPASSSEDEAMPDARSL